MSVSTSIRSTGCCGSGGEAGCIRRAVCSCCRASRPPTTTPPPSGRRCVDNVDIYEISTKYLHYKYLGPGHAVRGQHRGIQIHSCVQVGYWLLWQLISIAGLSNNYAINYHLLTTPDEWSTGTLWRGCSLCTATWWTCSAWGTGARSTGHTPSEIPTDVQIIWYPPFLVWWKPGQILRLQGTWLACDRFIFLH